MLQDHLHRPFQQNRTEQYVCIREAGAKTPGGVASARARVEKFAARSRTAHCVKHALGFKHHQVGTKQAAAAVASTVKTQEMLASPCRQHVPLETWCDQIPRTPREEQSFDDLILDCLFRSPQDDLLHLTHQNRTEQQVTTGEAGGKTPGEAAGETTAKTLKEPLDAPGSGMPTAGAIRMGIPFTPPSCGLQDWNARGRRLWLDFGPRNANGRQWLELKFVACEDISVWDVMCEVKNKISVPKHQQRITWKMTTRWGITETVLVAQDMIPNGDNIYLKLDQVKALCGNCGKGESEGHLRSCCRCWYTVYCSSECQRSHWQKHRTFCHQRGRGKW